MLTVGNQVEVLISLHSGETEAEWVTGTIPASQVALNGNKNWDKIRKVYKHKLSFRIKYFVFRNTRSRNISFHLFFQVAFSVINIWQKSAPYTIQKSWFADLIVQHMFVSSWVFLLLCFEPFPIFLCKTKLLGKKCTYLFSVLPKETLILR